MVSFDNSFKLNVWWSVLCVLFFSCGIENWG
jgi:hypothetical protein